MADELPESLEDEEGKQPRAQWSRKARCRSLRGRMAVRGMGVAGPDARRAGLRSASGGMAGGGRGGGDASKQQDGTGRAARRAGLRSASGGMAGGGTGAAHARNPRDARAGL